MAGEVEGGRLRVLDPTNDATSVEARLAPRLDTLDGKVLGLMHNDKLNAERFLALLEGELGKKYRFAEVVWAVKPHPSLWGPEELLAGVAARCDAVITALGD